jgi:hypothetical protein
VGLVPFPKAEPAKFAPIPSKSALSAHFLVIRPNLLPRVGMNGLGELA